MAAGVPTDALDAAPPAGGAERPERVTPTIVIDRAAHWGRWWAVLQPAVQVGVFTVLFGALARVPSDGVPYPVFALAGLLPWNLFSKIVADGAISLAANQHLITKLFFPRVYLVLEEELR